MFKNKWPGIFLRFNYGLIKCSIFADLLNTAELFYILYAFLKYP